MAAQDLSTVADRIVTAAGTVSSPSRQSSPVVSPTSPTPPPANHEADVEIPRRVWSAFTPKIGNRKITRELGGSEQDVIYRRIAQLGPALRPFDILGQGDRVALAITAMLGGFTSARERGGDVVAKVNSVMTLLARFPVWAIEAGCMSIRENGYEVKDATGTRMEKNWPPSDPAVFGIVQAIVAPYAAALDNARAILKAEVEPPELPAPRFESVQPLNFGENQNLAEAERLEEDGAKKRKIADMAARSARERVEDYYRAGVEPPPLGKGQPIVSLAMRLKLGWEIRETRDGKVLLSPKEIREAAS